MVRNKLLKLALLLTVAPAISLAAVIAGPEGAPPKEFKYLGSYNPPTSKLPPVTGGANVQQVTSYYFLSQNAAAYITAQNDCKAYLGSDAALLFIETQEELANVTAFLHDNDDTGSYYWVGGRYDPKKATFIWENKAEIGPWAPWDTGYPDTKTSLTRVYAETAGHLKFRTQFNTVSTRYICELKSGDVEEEAKPCYSDNDLVVVLDSSGSIGQEHYMVALEFTVRLGIAWADSPANRFAFIVFSSASSTVFSLSENLTVQQIRDKVYNTSYSGGGTASHLGLNQALQEFTANPRAVPQNMVF